MQRAWITAELIAAEHDALTLTVVKSQKVATAEQLAQAKRNFEVGTATITDTHEAQARYDLIVAQEIQAQNDLENKLRALHRITSYNVCYTKLLRLAVPGRIAGRSRRTGSKTRARSRSTRIPAAGSTPPADLRAP